MIRMFSKHSTKQVDYVNYLIFVISDFSKMIELLNKTSLKNYTVVFPSVSVGNVGQLAVDLLISSLNLTKLGYVWHPSILSFAGADPFGNSEEFSTGCELFMSHSLQLIVFQIRSAFVCSKRNFFEEISDWLKENQISQVIILSGVSAHERKDKQLIGEPLRYVFCPMMSSEERDKAKSRNWLELESISNDNGSIPTYLPGAGITLKFFEKLVKEKLRSCLLLEFCSDGNNTPDAVKLADYLDEWLFLKEKAKIDHWLIPPSWNLVFGPQPPTEIFN